MFCNITDILAYQRKAHVIEQLRYRPQWSHNQMLLVTFLPQTCLDWPFRPPMVVLITCPASAPTPSMISGSLSYRNEIIKMPKEKWGSKGAMLSSRINKLAKASADYNKRSQKFHWTVKFWGRNYKQPKSENLLCPHRYLSYPAVSSQASLSQASPLN